MGELTLLDNLAAVAEAELGNGTRAMQFLRIATENRDYDRNSALTMLAVSTGRSGESWAERGLALLFLENQILRLSSDDLTEFDHLLVARGIKPGVGSSVPLRASILREGYSTVSLQGFAVELLRRLRRLNRVHHPILVGECDQVAWGYFLRVARDFCKLTLARYVFNLEEVFGEIERTLLVTEGAEDTFSLYGEQPAAWWAREPFDAPDFEMELLAKLCAGRSIYWVSERCGSELNSLVEYPLTSAVVTIKPPGSDLEIEIKRAGTRGPRLLDVIAEQNGHEAPISHRLYGGSLGWLAQRETVAAGIFSKIFRLVHGTGAPCSRGVSNSSVVSVPTREGPVHLLDYLTDKAGFGPGFDKTREAMRVCVRDFPSDTGVARGSYTGEHGETLRFIGQALPQQAVIVGSSSFGLIGSTCISPMPARRHTFERASVAATPCGTFVGWRTRSSKKSSAR